MNLDLSRLLADLRDVLIVLDRIERYGSEIDRTGDLASRLSLKHGVTVSRVFAAESDWLTG